MGNQLLRIYIIVLLAVVLSGCTADERSNNVSASTPQQTVESSITSVMQTEEIDLDSLQFSGLEPSQNEWHTGNALSCLNCNGWIWKCEETIIFADSNGDFIMTADEQKTIFAEGVFPSCINVMDDQIFYINSSDQNKCYQIDMNSLEQHVYIDEPLSYLLILDNAAVYETEQHDLYIRSDEEITCISDQRALWVTLYEDYLIYTELDNDCALIAYHMISGEKIKIADYGFSPAVKEEKLYFQNQDGKICCISLKHGYSEVLPVPWGQQFCFLQDNMYFLSSNGVFCYDNEKAECIYQAENTDNPIEALFECDGSLFIIEKSNNGSEVFQLDVISGERIALQ